jgi:hypothetical protein
MNSIAGHARPAKRLIIAKAALPLGIFEDALQSKQTTGRFAPTLLAISSLTGAGIRSQQNLRALELARAGRRSGRSLSSPRSVWLSSTR